MRDYDGIEYRYKSSDADKQKALTIIRHFLGFTPEVQKLNYDLTLYAGGIGICDKLAISCLANAQQWQSIKTKYVLLTPAEALLHGLWSEDFCWLVKIKNQEPIDINGIFNFINQNKLHFQQDATTDSIIYFVEWSDVNSWGVIWGKGEDLNYLSYEQG